MSSKPLARRDARLSMAMTNKDRKLVDRAAGILELPPSVWGRSVLLKEAAKIISTAEAVKA